MENIGHLVLILCYTHIPDAVNMVVFIYGKKLQVIVAPETLSQSSHKLDPLLRGYLSVNKIIRVPEALRLDASLLPVHGKDLLKL